MSPEKLFYKDLKLSSSSATSFIVGADEVGRGALAGPVVSCSVGIKANTKGFRDFEQVLLNLGVCDSKKLNLKKRHTILESLGISQFSSRKVHTVTFNRKFNFIYKLDFISPNVVDKINVLEASLLSFKNSCESLFNFEKGSFKNSHVVFIDGKFIPRFSLPLNAQAVIKGDEKSVVIGLASIIAKITRDNYMKSLSEKFPHYGFEKNVGYPTAMHKKALLQLGPSSQHRLSYRPVRELCKKEV